MIIDAHLDLSYNALRGRDVLRPAVEQLTDAQGVPTVGLPDLRQGRVDLICATIFVEPSIGGKPGYRNADEAHAQSLDHLRWYRDVFESKLLHQVNSRHDITSLVPNAT